MLGWLPDVTLVLLLLGLQAGGGLPPERRIVFLGDSITQGGRYVEIIEAALIARHPDSQKAIIPLGLASETVSGLSEPGHADGRFPRPDLHERLGRVLEKAKPDLVLACYGMNDGIYHPLDAARMKAFQDGMRRLREKAAVAGARVIHLTPPVFDPGPIRARVLPAGLEAYPTPYEGYDDVLAAYAGWLTGMREEGWAVLDIHGPMKAARAERLKTDPAFTFSKDGVHPGPEGHVFMARPVLEAWGLEADPDGTPRHPNGAAILATVRRKHALLRPAWLSHVGHTRPGVGRGLPLDEAEAKAASLDAEARRLARSREIEFPNRTGDWHGYAKHELQVVGKSVTVVAPKTPAPGRPWVWHGEFFGHKPAPDVALLDQGFHVAYVKIPDMLGSPGAVEIWDAVYAELVGRYKLDPKPALVGLSRGGLYCYAWAVANPHKVSCIYADAPVCDFKSWPGGKGKGRGDPKNWALVMKLWGFKDEAEALAYGGNPVDRLEPLARAGVPLLHVFGDADDVVPWEENTGLVETRYRALGGPITLIRKPGVGHHPHGLEDSAPIVDFIRKHAARPR